MMRRRLLTGGLLSALVVGTGALGVAACGAVAGAPPTDGGTATDGGRGDTTIAMDAPQATDGHPQAMDTQPQGFDGPASGGDGPFQADSAPVVLDATSGSPVDAGYYYGDGSYFVDGGAYPDVEAPTDAATDSGPSIADASPGCAALSACCASLPPATQSLCDAVVGLGNAANCAAELAQLQGAGDCTGVSVLASEVQVPPNVLVSDGALLFWTTTTTPALLSMPVGGGAIKILLTGPIANSWGASFLAVDGTNVYVLQNDALVRIPKGGGGATLVNEPGARLMAVTSLGGSAYWVELTQGGPAAVFSTPLLGGSISAVATVQVPGAEQMAVTSGAFFFTPGSQGGLLMSLTTSGQAGGGVEGGTSCDLLTSDKEAVYCTQSAGSNLSIASDGAVTSLGTAINSSYITFDDTYVYWADATNVGSILKAPKTGGPATVLAWDTGPTAIAVDSRSVYWSDMGGYIKSMPK